MCLSHLTYTVRPCLIHTCHAAPMPCSGHAVLLKATAQYGRRETAWARLATCESALRRRSAPARLLRLWIRIPPGAWMFVCCVCCVLSGRGLCDGLITRPEESYQLWCVVVCDLETSSGMRTPWTALGCRATGGKKSKVCFRMNNGYEE